MKNITVKVNNKSELLATHQLATKSKEPLIIDAMKNVNYELINADTNVAPQHIVTKRVGDDLHLSFDADDQDTDLVIQNFYTEGDQSALVGQAEDSNYYYFIPDSGEVQDFVTELASDDIEGQALGGEAIEDSSWQTSFAGIDGFSVVPWLVWLGALTYTVVSDKSDHNDNTAEDYTINGGVLTPGSDGLLKLDADNLNGVNKLDLTTKKVELSFDADALAHIKANDLFINADTDDKINLKDTGTTKLTATKTVDSVEYTGYDLNNDNIADLFVHGTDVIL